MQLKERRATPLLIPHFRALPKEAVKDLLNFNSEGYSIFDLSELEGGHYPDFVLVHKAPVVHNPPLRHEGSDARYLIDYYEGDDRIMVSHLPPNSRTSLHHHPDSPVPLVETYFCLAGSFLLRDEELSIKPKGHIVLPRRFHQVTTKDEAALILIVMKDARFYPEDQQHLR